MTQDDNDNEPDESEAESESLDDVMGALEGAGYTEPEDDTEDDTEADSPGLPGPLAALEELTGTGKSLESYADSPIASAVGPEGSQGAMHIARGIDGLSPLGAMHPLMDIGIGVVLIRMEKRDAEGEDGPDLAAERDDGDDVPDLGDTT